MTPHFTDAELACRCGCGGLPGLDFAEDLELLRIEYGRPMIITSGYRCPEWNAQVSSTGATGPHTQGLAVDVQVYGDHALRLLVIAAHGGWSAGVSQSVTEHARRFLHLDLCPSGIQPRPWLWSY